MALSDQPNQPRRRWFVFRRLRRLALGLIVLFLLALLYLNQAGFPDFIKRPLLDKLRARGLELQFSRLRWRPGRGLVAQNVMFGKTGDPVSPTLTVNEVQLKLSYVALLRRRFPVRALLLDRGILSWPVPTTNAAARELTLDGIQTEIQLLPGDVWQLNNFQAEFLGARFQFVAAITNASAVRTWKWLPARKTQESGRLQERLQRLADLLEQIHFSTPPRLDLDARGDARDPQSFSVRLALRAPDANTPWGTLNNGALTGRVFPATDADALHAELNLRADRAQTRWAAGTNFALTLRLFSTGPTADEVRAGIDVIGEQIDTHWGSAASAHFSAQWLHAMTNLIPTSGQGELELARPETQWGRAASAQLGARLVALTNAAPVGGPAWSLWTNIAPYALNLEGTVSGLESPRLNAAQVAWSGNWRAPVLQVEKVSARLYDGTFTTSASLNVDTREFSFNTASDFDLQKITPLLTPMAREWFGQFAWKKAPMVQARGALTLPAWTNREPNWRGEVRPTIRLAGNFKMGEGAFRGITFNTAESRFSYSNLCWQLPDIVVTRPEGRLYLFHEANDATRDFYFRFSSTIDPMVIRPLLHTNEQRAFDLLTLSQPPLLEGEIRGRWRDYGRTAAKLRASAVNFSFRGQSATEVRAGIEYTNLVLKFIEPRLSRGTQQLAAASLMVDFRTKRIFVTNGFSTADPQVVARAIGPKIAGHVEPYHFVQPPSVRVEGVIPMGNVQDADLHFDVDGGAFSCWKFNVPRVAGRIDWVGKHLALRSVQADFYRGTAVGNAQFDFEPDHGANLDFDAVVTGADVHQLARDFSPKTNKLEGRLTARIAITHANTLDWQSVQGSGRASLRDGLLWDIPMFGIFSPALDGIVAGLGDSRAREASATFIITNGVLKSDDLDIRASGMRLRYRGSVDYRGRMDARVEAELLRDTWVFGRVLSAVLWPVTKVFEYKVTGTVQDPKSEPLFLIPRIVLMPFHPLKTMKELAPDDGTSKTNLPQVIERPPPPPAGP
jgi:hypothetical protein